jgi:hypothetical protein
MDLFRCETNVSSPTLSELEGEMIIDMIDDVHYVMRVDDIYGADLYMNGDWVYKRQWKYDVICSSEYDENLRSVMPLVFVYPNLNYNEEYEVVLNRLGAPAKCLQVYSNPMIELKEMSNVELENLIEEKGWKRFTIGQYDEIENLRYEYQFNEDLQTQQRLELINLIKKKIEEFI